MLSSHPHSSLHLGNMSLVHTPFDTASLTLGSSSLVRPRKNCLLSLLSACFSLHFLTASRTSGVQYFECVFCEERITPIGPQHDSSKHGLSPYLSRTSRRTCSPPFSQTSSWMDGFPSDVFQSAVHPLLHTSGLSICVLIAFATASIASAFDALAWFSAKRDIG